MTGNIVMLFIGLAIGGIAVWLVLKARVQQASDKAKSEGDVERAALTERVQGKEQQIQSLNAALEKATGQMATLQSNITTLTAAESKLQTTIEKERKAAEEKLALLNEAQEQLSDAFKAL